jgi:RNA polymerase sigma-70 factor (ECF subfamily)
MPHESPVMAHAEGRARGQPIAEQAALSQGALYDLVYRQMFALTGRHHHDLEDLVQTAALEVLRSYSSFEGRCALSTWTYRICYRTLIRQHRWYKKWLDRFTWSPDGVLPDAVDSMADAAEQIEHFERCERLRRAVASLSPKRRAVVVLRDLEGLSIAEVAEIVDAREHTVRSRLRDARKDLLRALKDDPYFGDDGSVDPGGHR